MKLMQLFVRIKFSSEYNFWLEHLTVLINVFTQSTMNCVWKLEWLVKPSPRHCFKEGEREQRLIEDKLDTVQTTAAFWRSFCFFSESSIKSHSKVYC